MKIREKTTAILIAILMISTIAFAVIASPGIEFVGDASYSDTTANSGTYSVRLGTAEPDWDNWAGVQIPYGYALGTFITTGIDEVAVLDVSNTYFHYNIETGLEGQVPIVAFVFEGMGDLNDETWKLILAPPLPTYEQGDGNWYQLMEPFTTAHLWRLESPSQWTAGGVWGAIPLFEELGWWQLNGASPIDGEIVDAVEVSIGTGSATVYVDDVTINGVTYDFEPGSVLPMQLESEPGHTITATAGSGGSISPGTLMVPHETDQTFDIVADFGYHILDVVVDTVSQGAVSEYTFYTVTGIHAIHATFEADIVSINVLEADVDFEKVVIGTMSGIHEITVSSTGSNVDVYITAEVAGSGKAFFDRCLTIETLDVTAWPGAEILLTTGSIDLDLQLDLIGESETGSFAATLIFWAEAS